MDIYRRGRYEIVTSQELTLAMETLSELIAMNTENIQITDEHTLIFELFKAIEEYENLTAFQSLHGQNNAI